MIGIWEELKLMRRVNKQFAEIKAEAGIVGKGTKEQQTLSESIHKICSKAVGIVDDNKIGL